MKNLIWIIVLFFCTNCVPKKEVESNENNKVDGFKLTYSSAGLGSNMGGMQPTLKVIGQNYIYTYQQNSYYGKPDKQPDTICTGTFRTSSIDSIMNLVKDINDTLVYRTNPDVMSGGIYTIRIVDDTVDLTFRLHNASDPTAQQIVDILNSNLPADKEKLWLFNDFSADEIQEQNGWGIDIDTIK